jgi:8-oxo-dGTP diphosphatase
MGKSDQGLGTGGRRYTAVPRVLIFLRNGPDVLLLKGAPDKRIWAKLYNGVGGHVEADEDVYSAAIREVKEETGLQVSDLSLKAVVNINAGDDGLGILMIVFVGWSDQRDTISSPEGELEWLPADSLADYPLVEDLTWILPRVLDRPQDSQPLFLHYSYNSKDELVIRSS